MEKMKKNMLVLAIVFAMLLPSFALGAEDDFVVPFNTMLKTWMTGNVGVTIALIIMIISVIAGAFGGGFGMIGKGFILSIIVGGIVWFAEKGFDIGTGFNSMTP
ncbi:hypothetical protein N5U23_03995 [Aliarcobacter butzleri]|uniref:hypothetical protein n=1 Tax=Aliarcobacter butzleri TaxID=28197 RepID=UPI0021B20BE5|nr:hypothetical protein [Aliarcobacter butzleri]MCT7563172.1 hypothetical protein [Aliarcobacter butzleri]